MFQDALLVPPSPTIRGWTTESLGGCVCVCVCVCVCDKFWFLWCHEISQVIFEGSEMSEMSEIHNTSPQKKGARTDA